MPSPRLAASCLPLVALTFAAASAEAKQARCYTTDDGFYACEFAGFNADGSFTISAPTKLTYTLTMVDTGAAAGFSFDGTTSVRLPGTFHRNQQDRACWVSDATQFTICAY